MQVSIDLANALLNLLLRSVPYNPPAEWWIGLLTTMPGSNGSGSVEVAGGGYARRPVAFGVAADRSAVNSIQATYPQATASWGTVIGIAFYETETGGSPKLWDDVAPLAVSAGSQPRIEATGLTVQYA
jgi:hypothetical protein